jgi:hypothetical protein
MEGSWWSLAVTVLVTMLITWQWLLKARADRAQGWCELWRSLLEFLLVLVVVGLVGLVMVRWGR